MEYQVRETTNNTLIKTYQDEEEAAEFIQNRAPGAYMVWSVVPINGRVIEIIKGSNFVDRTIHYEPEEAPVAEAD